MNILKHITLDDATRDMIQVRTMQLVINELLKQNRFKIPVHMAFGYEAFAVAVAHCKSNTDRYVFHHRNIAYQLAFLRDMAPVLAEFSGKDAGAAGGKLGSMNLAPKGTTVAYTTSILGNGLPMATGIALYQKCVGNGGITLVTIGDGGIEEGACYESLIFARSHGLRLVVLFENNNQSMSSTIEQRRCRIDWDKFSECLGVDFFRANGNSVKGCLETLSAARQTCLEKQSPVLLEVSVYPFNQHAGATPGWPGDSKNINIEDGLFLQPYENDPLYEDHAANMKDKDDFFRLCLDEINKGYSNIL